MKHDILIWIFPLTISLFPKYLYMECFLTLAINFSIKLSISCQKGGFIWVEQLWGEKILRKYLRRLLSTESKSKVRLLVFDACQERISSEAFNVRENVIGNVMNGYYHRLALPHCTKTSHWAYILTNILGLVYFLSCFLKRWVVKKELYNN